MPTQRYTDEDDVLATLEINICEQVAALMLLQAANRQSIVQLRETPPDKRAPERFEWLSQLEKRIGTHRRKLRSLQAEYESLRQAGIEP